MPPLRPLGTKLDGRELEQALLIRNFFAVNLPNLYEELRALFRDDAWVAKDWPPATEPLLPHETTLEILQACRSFLLSKYVRDTSRWRLIFCTVVAVTLMGRPKLAEDRAVKRILQWSDETNICKGVNDTRAALARWNTTPSDCSYVILIPAGAYVPLFIKSDHSQSLSADVIALKKMSIVLYDVSGLNQSIIQALHLGEDVILVSRTGEGILTGHWFNAMLECRHKGGNLHILLLDPLLAMTEDESQNISASIARLQQNMVHPSPARIFFHKAQHLNCEIARFAKKILVAGRQKDRLFAQYSFTDPMFGFWSEYLQQIQKTAGDPGCKNNNEPTQFS